MLLEYKEKVKLIKKNGQIINDILAIVQPKKIFIKDKTAPIEEGDFFEITLPSGIVQKKKVIDPGYFGDHPKFPAYQCEVENIKMENSKAKQSIYNISGPNSRININSIDHSKNQVNLSEKDIFKELEKAIDRIENNQKIKENLNELRAHQKKESFTQKYKEFISACANHMSIISPFIPALTEMINK